MPKRSANRSASDPAASAEYALTLIDYKAFCEAKMGAFDRLPKTVRAALTDSQFNWNIEQLYQGWRKRRMTARQMVKHIRNEDRIRLRDRRI